jgi:hypothetical protein
MTATVRLAALHMTDIAQLNHPGPQTIASMCSVAFAATLNISSCQRHESGTVLNDHHD